MVNVPAEGERAFSVEEPDERGPALISVLSGIIALQRYHGVFPRRIRLNADVYIAIGRYMGTCTVDRLFNVPVEANLDSDAVPFIIESEVP